MEVADLRLLQAKDVLKERTLVLESEHSGSDPAL